MSKQLYLFTGEDGYRLEQEVTRRTQGFATKHGQESVMSFGSDREVADVLSQLQGGGLFAQERMVVIRGVPSDSVSGDKRPVALLAPIMDQIKRLHDQRPSDLWLVLISAKPDKRTADYKWFKKEADIKVFDRLKWSKLASWLTKECEGLLTSSQATAVTSRVGNDTRLLMSEIDKLRRYQSACAYRGEDSTITDDVLRRIVVGEHDADVFQFVKRLATDTSSAIQLVDDVHRSGVYWVQFWGSITWWLRSLVLIMSCLDDGMTDSKEIASYLKLHPFAVWQSKSIARDELAHDGGERMRGFLGSVIDLDYHAKTGRIGADEIRQWLKREIVKSSK